MRASWFDWFAGFMFLATFARVVAYPWHGYHSNLGIPEYLGGVMSGIVLVALWRYGLFVSARLQMVGRRLYWWMRGRA